MNDDGYISNIEKITDPIELLKVFLECENMLRGDFYYRDFHNALMNTARDIVTKSEKS